ncbi:MAG: tyrosine--tRNA ligase [Patescibacteria group bacterium]|nr:MAG: tyrosine--tRNA ligase [Patescibacteria group bacterium]
MKTKKNLFDELEQRNLIYDFVPKTREHLQKPRKLYVGVDPTADSLHIGHLLQFITLKRAINFGHKGIVIIGGGTALIGDPSGKNEERPILSKAEIKQNIQNITNQIKKLLPEANFINNEIWFKNLKLIEFLRDVGKYISINTMSDLEFIKNRLKNNQYLSLAEFTYQTLQSYDFYQLFSKENCTVQFGGSDQWGNIIQGVEFIKKKTGKQAFAFSLPLIIDPDTGKKFGKTEKGKAIWLDPSKTSPFEFYQFIYNAKDNLIENLIFYYSLKKIDYLKEIINEHNKNPEKRLAQKTLAEELIKTIYDNKTLYTIEKLNSALFQNKLNDIDSISKNDLKRIINTYPTEQKIDITNLLIKSQLANSKKEANRLIKQNAITKFETKKYIIIRKGKKNFAILIKS